MNPSASPATPSGPTDLKIRVEGGSGTSQTWTLTCDPPAGDHPDPAAACQALAAHGAAALPAVRKDVVCTDQYGGPQQAVIAGTHRGSRVWIVIGMRNGCDISRAKRLAFLVPGFSANPNS